MNQDDSAEVEEFSPEIQEHVKDIQEMSEAIDMLRGSRHGSPKVNDKKRSRAKAKKARISRRANRG